VGKQNLWERKGRVKPNREVRAADAKEVGVGNPAEETYCHPNMITVIELTWICQPVIDPTGPPRRESLTNDRNGISVFL